MKSSTIAVSVASFGLLAATLAVSSLSNAQAQATSPNLSNAPENRCILAGRLDAEARWSPALRHIELVDAQGNALQVLAGAEAKGTLDKVKQVRVKAPALLSSCNGTAPLAKGEDSAATPKGPVPAVAAGAALIPVESVNLPAGRFAGQWVELKLALAPDRVAMIQR